MGYTFEIKTSGEKIEHITNDYAFFTNLVRSECSFDFIWPGTCRESLVNIYMPTIKYTKDLEYILLSSICKFSPHINTIINDIFLKKNIFKFEDNKIFFTEKNLVPVFLSLVWYLSNEIKEEKFENIKEICLYLLYHKPKYFTQSYNSRLRMATFAWAIYSGKIEVFNPSIYRYGNGPVTFMANNFPNLHVDFIKEFNIDTRNDLYLD
jgi:hypothetical protein